MHVATLQAGQQVGSWVLQQRVHQGHQSEIWKAKGPNRTVALKITTSTDWNHALGRESGLLAESQVPGVVRFHESEAGGRWMAMDWIEGVHSTVWSSNRSLMDIATLLQQLSHTLSLLHSCGLVHGDLAPANILVDAHNTPHLVDFGLGVGTEPVELRIGMHGTPGYLAPELLEGGTPTIASDLYGLGALAFRLLTGRHPFADVEPHALQWIPKANIPVPPSNIRTDIPLEIDAIVLRLLSRDATQRPKAHQIAPLWEDMAARATARPIVGNNAPRASLRESIARAQEGQRVQVLVHGNRGSGRRTLIDEAARLAQLYRVPTEIIDMDTDPHLDPISPQWLKKHPPSEPGLRLVRARKAYASLEEMGWTHIRVVPLSKPEIQTILSWFGEGLDRLDQIHQESQGHPAAVWAHLGFTEELKPINDSRLRLMASLSEQPRSIELLSRQLGISEHQLLDLAEPMLEQGLLIELDDGRYLGLPGHQL